MISGATESSYIFLNEYFKCPEDVYIHHDPKQLLKNEHKLKVLWAHHNWDQPIYNGTDWNKIDHIVCVSNWEKEEFIKNLKIIPEKITVIRNGGNKNFKPSNNKSKTLIYTSIPYKGLEFLPYIFTQVLKEHPDTKLKIFSSMSLYGMEDKYDDLYWILKRIPNVEYSPAVEHDKLITHLQESLIFVHPNVWEETSCVSLIEAMRCGCYPIISNIGALPETSNGFGSIIPIEGERKSDGWKPTKKFCDGFANEIVNVLNNYQYDPKIADFSCGYYDWEKISKEWYALIDRLKKGKNKMSFEINKLTEMPSKQIVKDSEVLSKVYEEVFKWEQYDKEHAQGRSNFQIEKFIALDNFTVASSFNSLLKNRRIMAEGLFSKIIEMKEKQREFDMKWSDTPKDKPIEFGIDGNKKYCWHDLDSLTLENYLRSCELEIRDRIQQIEFFDKLLNKLLEMNGGPITKEQFEEEDHIYWERRFANQAYDELLSHQTGISIGNLNSIRRATAPTLVSNDQNRIKNNFPELTKLMSGTEGKTDFLLALQEKVIDGITEVTGLNVKSLAQENISQRLTNDASTTITPKSLFNSEYEKK